MLVGWRSGRGAIRRRTFDGGMPGRFGGALLVEGNLAPRWMCVLFHSVL